MCHLHTESHLAHLVVRKVQVSLGLVVGLRGPLREAGRSDLVEILDLLSQGLRETGRACQTVIGNRRKARQLAVDAAMGSIEALGGPKARHAATVLAANLSSGSYQAYVEPKSHSVQIPSKKK